MPVPKSVLLTQSMTPGGDILEYRRLRQLMEKLYRVAKDKFDEDGDYEKFRKVEKTFEEEVTKLDLKFPGLF